MCVSERYPVVDPAYSDGGHLRLQWTSGGLAHQGSNVDHNTSPQNIYMLRYNQQNIYEL